MLQGMNQLLWYYADLEKQKCLDSQNTIGEAEDTESDFLSHLGGRRSNKVKKSTFNRNYSRLYF